MPIWWLRYEFLANGKIHKNTKFKNIFIPPSPGDGGAAVGSAVYFFTKNNNKKIDSNFIGYTGKKNILKKKLMKLLTFIHMILIPKILKFIISSILNREMNI